MNEKDDLMKRERDAISQKNMVQTDLQGKAQEIMDLRMVIVIFFPICIVYWTVNLGHRGCDRMVVGFTTTYAISAHHH